jgi:hypothetical protein
VELESRAAQGESQYLSRYKRRYRLSDCFDGAFDGNRRDFNAHLCYFAVLSLRDERS